MLSLLTTSDQTTTILGDGSLTHTRRASSEDYALAADLHARCSPAGRAQRYGGGKPGLSKAEWTGWMERRASFVLLTTPAQTPRRAVAMTCIAELADEPGVCDIALLITDQAPDNYQSLGLGTALADLAADLARASGFHTLAVTTSLTNWRALAIVEHLGGPVLPHTAHLRNMALLGVRPDLGRPAQDIDLRIRL